MCSNLRGEVITGYDAPRPAKSTSDRQLPAALLDKAAELQSHEICLPDLSPPGADIDAPDRTPLAPDVEPSAGI